MTAISDLDKKLTLGDPDGPERFIPELGMTVPTYIDPRDDLIPEHAKGKFQRLDFHVPFKMRGSFFPHDWPIEFYNTVRGGLRTTLDGHVQCHGKKKDGELCKAQAVNRGMFCRSHGCALAAADKKISGMTLAPIEESRIESLDRVQKFMQGLLLPEELDDDEVQGQFVRNDDGVPVKTAKLGGKFQAQLGMELHSRLNQYLQSKTPRMLEVMYEIADSDFVEAADRIKAASWIAERTMGKQPEVIYHGRVEKPYEDILDFNVATTSREDYRKSISSERVAIGEADAILEVESEELSGEQEDFGQEGIVDGSHSNGNGTDISNASRGDNSAVGIAEAAETIKDKRARAQELRKAKSKARQRRYAARALGGTTVQDLPFLVEYVKIKDSKNFRMKIIMPDKQTQRVVDRHVALAAVDSGETGNDQGEQE